MNVALLALLLTSVSNGVLALPLPAEKIKSLACQSNNADLFTQEIELLGLMPVDWAGGDDPIVTHRAAFKSPNDDRWATFALYEIQIGPDQQGNTKYARWLTAEVGIEGGNIELAKSYLQDHKELFPVFHAPTISYGAGYSAKWTVRTECGVTSLHVGYDALLNRTLVGWRVNVLPETQ